MRERDMETQKRKGVDIIHLEVSSYISTVDCVTASMKSRTSFISSMSVLVPLCP